MNRKHEFLEFYNQFTVILLWFACSILLLLQFIMILMWVRATERWLECVQLLLLFIILPSHTRQLWRPAPPSSSYLLWELSKATRDCPGLMSHIAQHWLLPTLLCGAVLWCVAALLLHPMCHVYCYEISRIISSFWLWQKYCEFLQFLSAKQTWKS